MVTSLLSTAAVVLLRRRRRTALENEREPEPDGYGGDVDIELVVSPLPGYEGPDLLEQIRRVKKKRGGAT